MNRLRLLVVLFVVLLPLTPVTAASAEGAGSGSVKSGWWWLPQQSGSPLPSPLAAGEIAVGRQASAVEKTAAVAFDMRGITAPPSSVTVTLKEAAATVATKGAAILACPIQTDWAPAKAGAWAQRPRGGCVAPWLAFGQRAADGTWTFDITEMARAWHAGLLPNHGFELFPAQSVTAPSYQIALNAPSPESIRAVVGGAVVLPAGPSSSPAAAPATPKRAGVRLFNAHLPMVFQSSNPPSRTSTMASESGMSPAPILAELASQFSAGYGEIVSKSVRDGATSDSTVGIPVLVALLALGAVAAAAWRAAARGLDVQPMLLVLAASRGKVTRFVGAAVHR